MPTNKEIENSIIEARKSKTLKVIIKNADNTNTYDPTNEIALTIAIKDENMAEAVKFRSDEINDENIGMAIRFLSNVDLAKEGILCEGIPIIARTISKLRQEEKKQWISQR